MNCSEIISSLGFHCKELADGALRLWSPFTYGRDGQVIALYVEPTNSGYLISDNAESFMHASAMGATLSKSRMQAIRSIAGANAEVTKGGEIVASASDATLGSAVVGVLNAALAVSHYERQWVPRSPTAFSEAVGRVLESIAPDRLKRNVIITGASGHEMRIPFAVTKGLETTYIQPVAYGDGAVDWSHVYRGLGKMLDLKNAGIAEHSRTIIVEDVPDDEDIDKSVTLLSNAASVVYFSKIRPWAEQKFGIAA
jgi:hypothetical protein